MSTISIIGSGSMAEAIGTRAAAHGHVVEIIGRRTDSARALADRIGHGALVGAPGATPAGEIVVVAVRYADAVEAVTRHRDVLAGTIVVDITNPFTGDATGVVTTLGDSMSDRIAAVVPDAHVVKAFNTVFAGVIAADDPIDALYAGDSSEAKARVAGFLDSIGMRPRDVGPLVMAHALEWAGVLLVGAANNGAGFDAALRVEVRGEG